MRSALLIATAAMLAGGPVLAQTTSTTAPNSTTTQRSSYVGGTDHGPFTPEASRAYQGGGMVLQGAPGAPPPAAEPTPPGQTPRNMVPR